MTYSPQAILAIYDPVDQHLPSMENSGVAASKSGYHNSYNGNKAKAAWRNNYSVVEALDQLGDRNAASAWDAKFNAKDMRTVTTRLMNACLAGDPRLYPVREWFGSYDGKTVTGYSVFRKKKTTSDPSHRWHIHISGWRKYANDRKAWLGVAEIVCGLAAGTLTGDAPLNLPKLLPVMFVDPAKVSTFLYGVDDTSQGRKPKERKPGFALATLVKTKVIDGATWYVTQAGFRYHGGFLTTVEPAPVVPPVVVPPVVKPTTPTKPDTTPKPTTPTTPPKDTTVHKITVGGGNILRETDTLAGRKRWPSRRANVIKHLKGAGSVLMLCEADKSTAADIAEGLGQHWSYYPSQFKSGKEFSPLAILWDSRIWRRDADAFVKEYADNENRYLMRLPLLYKASGRTVTFYASHLENDGDTSTDGHVARRGESRQWASWTLDGPGVFYADLNSTTRSGENATQREREKPRPILKGAGWRFLTDQAGVANRELASHHGGLGKAPKGPWIDDMGFKGVSYIDGEQIRTDVTDASDHHFFSITAKL